MMTKPLTLNVLYSSRSAVELRRRCTRARFLQYSYLRHGIVPVGQSIWLTTGTAIHLGIGYIANAIKQYAGQWKEIPITWIDEAVLTAVRWYKENVNPMDLEGGKVETREGRKFAFEEQQALVEALIRCWGFVEAPRILNRFKVVKVENDVCYPLDEKGLVQFESRADLLLRELDEPSNFFVYSLKSSRSFDDRTRNGLNHDLQGMTEIWATEKWFAERNAIRKSEGKKVIYPKRVFGVRFCVLVKGGRDEEKGADGNGTGIWFTYNPFTRGYRNLANSTSTLFAHSWYYDKAENKSGKGTLGKGWTPFYIWRDYKGGVRQWMLDIWNGKIQPDYSTGEWGHKAPFYETCIVPDTMFRRETDVKDAIEQITLGELRYFHDVDNVRRVSGLLGQEPNLNVFEQNRQSCFYPQECDFTPICLGDTKKGGCELDVALESGMYQERTPHHKQEMKAINKGETE